MVETSEYESFTTDDELWPFARNIYPQGYAYVVSWGEGADAIVKVGETWSARRWRGFLMRGGVIRRIVRSRASFTLDVERNMHVELAQTSPYAFGQKHQAIPFLGSGGAGWTECYNVDPNDAVAILEGVLNGLVQDRRRAALV